MSTIDNVKAKIQERAQDKLGIPPEDSDADTVTLSLSMRRNQAEANSKTNEVDSPFSESHRLLFFYTSKVYLVVRSDLMMFYVVDGRYQCEREGQDPRQALERPLSRKASTSTSFGAPFGSNNLQPTASPSNVHLHVVTASAGPPACNSHHSAPTAPFSNSVHCSGGIATAIAWDGLETASTMQFCCLDTAFSLIAHILQNSRLFCKGHWCRLTCPIYTPVCIHSNTVLFRLH
jgi:hypothetical protein